MGQPPLPQRSHRYQNMMVDSGRWDSFKPRDGDIIISTPPKAGTTWTQMICALLIFQKADFGRRLSEFTPWLDLKNQPLEDVLANYEGQTNRRFIKTHTPLDGIPYFETASYVVVGRDPRDAFLSMDNHRQNTSPEFMALIAKHSDQAPSDKDKGGEGRKYNPFDAPAKDIREQFRDWIAAQDTSAGNFDPDKSTLLHHLASFWAYRELPNIIFLHYSDMQRDLEGEMRRLAGFLTIDVPNEVMPVLVQAATFENMKQNADTLAPNAQKGIWRENSRFFNKGQSGQWRDVFGESELTLYRNVMDKLDPEFARWVESGRLGSAEA